MAQLPWIIAHQGASAACPPNTLAAFREALACGADIIELDVTCTRDGAVVVSHDLTVDACTDGHGEIAGMTLAQIKALDAGIRFGAQFARERIPTLAEALDWAREAGTRLCIEVKGESEGSYLQTARATLDLLQRRDQLQPVTLTSFSPACIQAARAWQPRLAWGLDPDERCHHSGWDLVQQVLACGATFLLHRHDTLTDEGLQELHAHGLAVWAWTADRPADLERLVEMGVDAIMTNRPDRLAGLLARPGRRAG